MWTRELGYTFYVKRTEDEWQTATENSFALPAGPDIEFRRVFTRAGNNTQRLLSEREVQPSGYMRL